MKLDLNQLGNGPIAVNASLTPDEVDLEGENAELANDAVIKGELSGTSERSVLEAVFDVDLKLDCGRCLEPVEQHFTVPFRDIFVRDVSGDAEREIELTDEALDESPLDEPTIDLAEIVREQILLAMPERPLCNEDCRGLCTKCGSNLNLIDCKCADDDIDPRWSALKNLN